MSYGKSLTRFEVEDECGRTRTIELDDCEVNDALCHVLVDKLGGDMDTWCIAVDEGLIDAECLSEELEKALHDYCYDFAVEQLFYE